MNKKISTIASLIKENSIIADIGCDHAYLSLLLFQQKKIKFAYNVDINEGPLSQGKKNLEMYGYKTESEFILNDGLKNKFIDVDYVIIAGMGASNIINIIEQSDSKTSYYVLQANNNVFLLRKFIKEKQYEIIDELLVQESNNYYEILLVKISNKTNIHNDIDVYIGPIFKQKETNEFKKYINDRINYLNTIVSKTLNNNIKQEFSILKMFMERKWQEIN